MAVETPSLFTQVIQEHLELKRRNAALEHEMPLEKYMREDPFENHPLFKTEEQARIEDTMGGTQTIVDHETTVDWPTIEDTFDTPPPLEPSEATVEMEAEPTEQTDESLWSRSRDFDWGDPRYLAQVAKLPAKLRAEGVKISKLVLVGVSYSGFANAELVALHPEIHADALVVVDSYLDLAARFEALPLHHETRAEMETVLGGTPTTKPAVYRSHSPSHHLLGLAEAIHHGTHLVVVWSTSPAERHEFHGATCSRLANALWLAQLAKILDHPVTGYVTQMRHAHALWDRGEGLLALAGVATTSRPLLAKTVTFRPGGAPPPASYC